MSKIRIRKRRNTYSYSFDISKNPRRMKEKGGFATEDEAFDAGVKAYADWKSGNIGVTSEKIKLRDYLASWLENVVRPNVKRTTYNNYHDAANSRITPHIGDIYLQELRPRDIDLWVNELAHAGLSQGTIRQTKTVLSTALKYAIYPAELIAVNPTTGINIPRSAPRKVVERTVITPEQFAAIPESNKFYPLLKILYHTGLRISEALGLTWDDIDLDTGLLSISRQRLQAGYFDTPKTATSARTFYVDALFLSYLRALKKEQTKGELRLGQAYQIAYESKDADRTLILLPKRLPPRVDAERRQLLCVHPTGIPYAHENVRYALYRLVLNSHSFRHTHATRLIESGAKPVDVAARLGHADATITQNLYAHDTEDMQQETARIFERFVDKGCL
ncbi:tyrosine-type recombinase/integrase [Selenomonas sp. oral taxon 136]|uniref:tyrosine-type recombinase/integrase n=1 Tax=Selenomonas sp. oral taxon 136 TaxID=713030 RepID=UPI000768325B|nr:site-specific integrase [Selenomonas sp. oral taxon 136]AME03356.1 integrase [Selenomonas sp. oral taxon 136]